MGETPERPASVPSGAVWNVERGNWQLGARDGSGRKQGEQLWFRLDGTLYERCSYVDDERHGDFVIYHPNGQVAREGAWEGGQLEGSTQAYASDALTHEQLRGCCVPPGAWEMRSSYAAGELAWERFFDRQGRELLSDGRVRPQPPSSLPANVEYDEVASRWRSAESQSDGTLRERFFTELGQLDREQVQQQGRLLRTRCFDERGACYRDEALDAEGRRNGSHYRRYLADELRPYCDPRIAREQGYFAAGEPLGVWLFSDAAGAVVRELDYGSPADASDMSHPAWRDAALGPSDLEELAARCLEQGNVRLALVAKARAAARSCTPGQLLEFLARHTVALNSEAGAALAAQLSGTEELSVGRLLSGVLQGGQASELLRELAGMLRSARVARDFVDAALLLDPERRRSYITRALLRLELGDPQGAVIDAELAGQESASGSEFVINYARVLFPAWSFWPAAETLEENPEHLPDSVQQPLGEVQRALQVYATRLAQLRAAALTHLGSGEAPAWLPPRLGELLPQGELPLARFTSSITDQTEQGPDTVSVEIDENLTLEGLPLSALQRLARCQWVAISWLCWACGKDEVGWLSQIDSHPRFAAAMARAFTRAYRARDALETAGLRSLTQGVASFEWENMNIESMEPHLAKVALDEYSELRALFVWLAFAENISPFQNDLRQP